MLTSIYDILFLHGLALLGSFLFVNPVRLEPMVMGNQPIFSSGGDDIRSPTVADA
jgi:hypothetical protein